MIVGVGTLALDSVETPSGSAHEVPGGSALYFGAAACLLARVALVGVTGEDFPAAPLARLSGAGVDVSGIRRLPFPTFRWRARYDASGHREILSVHAGGIERSAPLPPPSLRDADAFFLGSMAPGGQAKALDHAGRPGMVALDTALPWIRECRGDLEAVLPRVDVLLVNEDEVRVLGGADDESVAAAAVREMGPTWVVVKRGARGACAHGPHGRVEVAGVPVAAVVDPTGAGDAFAGGLVATLAGRRLSAEAMAEGIRAGARMGAMAVGAFSIDGLLGHGPHEGPRKALMS